METWQNLKVTDLGNINDGDWILNKNYSKFGVRLLQVGDIGLGKFVDKTNKFISENTANELNVSIVTPGKDILIARMPDPIGRACIAPFLPYKFIVAVDISILKVDDKQFDIRYIMQLLNSKPVLSKVQQKSAGATRIRISRTNLESIKLRVPILSEQTAIANILSTVDEAIQKADETITKTERIKQALMKKLFTEGIGHKEFKKTKIGMIPKTWTIKKFSEFVVSAMGGGTPSTKIESHWTGEIHWMTSANIDGKEVFNGQKMINADAVKNSATNLIPKDSLLIATRVGIGKACINRVDMAISQDLTGFVLNNQIKLEFLYWFLMANQTKLKSLAQGSTIKGILKSDILKMDIPFPDLKEQIKISNLLDDLLNLLELKLNRKRQLEKIKQGLMDDLLTGKKRIKNN